MILETMTWQDIDNVGPANWLPIIPTGVLEQHGPHLPIGTDNYVVWEVCQRAVGSHARTLLCPVMLYATATPMRNFPGSVIVRPETFIHVLRDACVVMARQGFTRALIVNGHGGNTHVAQTALREAAETDDRLKTHFIHLYDIGEPIWQEHVNSRRQGHACWYETSLLMAIRPDLVRKEKMTSGWFPNDGIPCRKEVDWWDWRKETPTGVLGDTEWASPETGQKILESMVNHVKQAVDKILGTSPQTSSSLYN